MAFVSNTKISVVLFQRIAVVYTGRSELPLSRRFFDAGRGATSPSELRAARVDKPRKEEAAGAGCGLWGKSADGCG